MIGWRLRLGIGRAGGREALGRVFAATWMTLLLAAGAAGLGAASEGTSGRPLDEGDDWTPVIVGQDGGDTKGLAALEDHVVLGVGPRLLVLDVSGGPPREVWRSELLSDVVADVAIDGHLAYAVLGHELLVLDVRDPEAPRRVAALYLQTLDVARRILVHEGFAYVGLESLSPHGFAVVDVRDPAAPHQLEMETWFLGNAREAAAAGSRLYVVPSLRVVDISDPTRASVVGTLDLEDDPWTVAASGHTVYACGRTWLYAIDASDPARPQVLGTVALDGGAIAVGDDRVFVAGRDGGLQVVDVTDPRNMRRIATEPLEGGVTEIVHAHGRLLAVAPGLGLRSYLASGDIDAGPARYDVWSRGSDVRVRAGAALVAAGAGGLAVVDVAEPSRPRTHGAVDVGGTALRVAVGAEGALVATEGRGVAIVSLADGQAPAVVGRVQSDEPSPVLAADGDLLFLLEPGAGRLRVVDVGDPAAPVVTDEVAAPEWRPSDARARDGWLYVSDREAGLRVLDGRDPSDVVPAGRVEYGTPGYSHGLALAADRAYAVRENPLRGALALAGPCCPPPPPPPEDELVEIDVSDPASPRRIRDMGAVGWPKGVAVVGAVVLVPSALGPYYGSTLHAVPVDGGPAVSIRLPAIPSGIASDGRHAYVVTSDGGLLVVAMVERATPTATATAGVTPTDPPTPDVSPTPEPRFTVWLPLAHDRSAASPPPTPVPPEHRYLFLEHWRHEEWGPGCPGLMIDFPMYGFDPETGVLRALAQPRLQPGDLGYYGSGRSLTGVGGGAASGLDRIEALPFASEALRLTAVSEGGVATIERDGDVLAMEPGAERQWSFVESRHEPGCVITATVRITNFGFQDRRKIEYE